MKKSFTTQIEEANAILISNGDLDAVGDFFASDYSVHITGHAIKGGHKIVRDVLGEILKSFPDIQVDVDIFMEEKERVAWQRTLRGTHECKFKSFPASGLQIVWRDMVISQFHNGLIAEEWVITDLAEQLLLSRKRKS